MSYHEFIQNIHRASPDPRDATVSVDSIVTEIMKLAQRQRNRKISRKSLSKKIKTMEKSIAHLPDYDLDTYKDYLLEEIRAIENRKGGMPCGKRLEEAQPDKTSLASQEIYEQIASDALRTSNSENKSQGQSWLAQCFFLREILTQKCP